MTNSTETERAELIAERAELVAKNEAATSWGAAVGARHERIVEIDRQLRRLAAQDQKPPPAAGWNEAIEAAMAIAKDMRDKYSSPTGDQYTQGLWDQSQRIIGKIKALRNNASPDTGAGKRLGSQFDVSQDEPETIMDSDDVPDHGGADAWVREKITALAHRFWSIHPSSLDDTGLTREQFYAREMTALVATISKPAPVAANTSAELQNDLAEMLRLLGMSDAAQPRSPHEVFQSAIAEMKRQLGNASAEARLRDLLTDVMSQFRHRGCECTFPSETCCAYAKAEVFLIGHPHASDCAKSDLMKNAEKASERVSQWSDAKQDYARRASDCARDGWLAKDVEAATKRVAEWKASDRTADVTATELARFLSEEYERHGSWLEFAHALLDAYGMWRR